MLSEKVEKALNAQINAEFWSAYLYLSMSADAMQKGYKGGKETPSPKQTTRCQ